MATAEQSKAAEFTPVEIARNILWTHAKPGYSIEEVDNPSEYFTTVYLRSHKQRIVGAICVHHETHWQDTSYEEPADVAESREWAECDGLTP